MGCSSSIQPTEIKSNSPQTHQKYLLNENHTVGAKARYEVENTIAHTTIHHNSELSTHTSLPGLVESPNKEQISKRLNELPSRPPLLTEVDRESVDSVEPVTLDSLWKTKSQKEEPKEEPKPEVTIPQVVTQASSPLESTEEQHQQRLKEMMEAQRRMQAELEQTEQALSQLEDGWNKMMTKGKRPATAPVTSPSHHNEAVDSPTTETNFGPKPQTAPSTSRRYRSSFSTVSPPYHMGTPPADPDQAKAMLLSLLSEQEKMLEELRQSSDASVQLGEGWNQVPKLTPRKSIHDVSNLPLEPVDLLPALEKERSERFHRRASVRQQRLTVISTDGSSIPSPPIICSSAAAICAAVLATVNCGNISNRSSTLRKKYSGIPEATNIAGPAQGAAAVSLIKRRSTRTHVPSEAVVSTSNDKSCSLENEWQMRLENIRAVRRSSQHSEHMQQPVPVL